MLEVSVRNCSGAELSCRNVASQQCDSGSLDVVIGPCDRPRDRIDLSKVELRQAIFVALGEGEHLTALDELLADSCRLRELEASVLKKVEMLRNSFWSISDEIGLAGELHAAITGLHIDLEGIAEQRDQLQEKLVIIA